MSFLHRALFLALVLVIPFRAAFGQVTTHTTPDGHRFSYVAMPEAKRTAVAVTWQADLPSPDTMHTSAPRLGIGLLLRGGSGGEASSNIAADFEDLDAAARLWVQPGEIRGFVVAPEQHLMDAATIADLVLSQPDFDERRLEREKRSLIRDTRTRNATASGTAWSLAREILLGDDPHAPFWSAAPEEAVRAVSPEQIAQWHRGAFGKNNLIITAAGSASPEVVAASIDRALQRLPEAAEGNGGDFEGPEVRPRHSRVARSGITEIADHGARSIADASG